MLFITENHQGPFCANCQYFRAHYYCHLGSFSPLHYGHCIRSQRSCKRKEYSVCPQLEPSDGAYNQPAAPCPHLSNCPFSQTKA